MSIVARTLLLAGLLAGVSTTPAAAVIQYDFIAYSSYPVQPGLSFSGRFSYRSPGYIGSSILVAPADLVSCNVIASNATASSCGNQGLYVGLGGPYHVVTFGFVNPGASGDASYYFAPGAFGAPGVYQTVLFGAQQSGQLTVTDIGDIDAGVPEPANWAMLVAGFGLVGAAVRRRRAAIRAAPQG